MLAFSTLGAAMCGPQLSNPDAEALLLLLLVAPVLEEWVVRAGLQQCLWRRGCAPWAALLICAAVFGLLHVAGGALAVAAVFWPGLALGLVYQRWRDWRLCALVHALFNASALAFCGLQPF